MKSNKQTMTKTNGGNKTESRKAPSKSARKTASPTARRSGPAAKRRRSSQPGNGHYGESLAPFVARAKSAIGDAYGWAGEATSARPKTMRGMGLPSHRSMRSMIEEKPLVLGALGLGIGVALGAMLPPATQFGARFARRSAKPHASGSARK